MFLLFVFLVFGAFLGFFYVNFGRCKFGTFFFLRHASQVCLEGINFWDKMSREVWDIFWFARDISFNTSMFLSFNVAFVFPLVAIQSSFKSVC